jgi:RNA polymerase sigma-B factor
MEAGHRTERDRLVEEHMGLVRAIARRHARGREPVEDLVQVGAIGLLKAIGRFDPGRGKPLRALAAASIEGEIRHHLRDRAGTVRTPGPLHALAARARAARADLEARRGRPPAVAEIAAELGADEAEVAAALAAVEPPVPLRAAEAPAAPPDRGDERALVEAGLSVLSGRERRIIELRYFEDRRQTDIARELGISQAQVSRLIRRALDRMRAALAGGEVPAPSPARPARAAGSHSGRLLVRMDPELHRRLAAAARADDLSLNAFITGRLERALDPPASAPDPPVRLLVANLAAVVVAIVVGLVLLAGALAGGW